MLLVAQSIDLKMNLQDSKKHAHLRMPQQQMNDNNPFWSQETVITSCKKRLFVYLLNVLMCSFKREAKG